MIRIKKYECFILAFLMASFHRLLFGFSLCVLSGLCGELGTETTYHKDTETTKVAQRPGNDATLGLAHSHISFNAEHFNSNRILLVYLILF